MFQSIAPVTLALIVTNVLAYFLQQAVGDPMIMQFALWPPLGEPGAPAFHLWQVVTYAFLHAGGTHLFFNMFALYMFGSDIERLLGRPRYLSYYMVCVVGAALAQIAVQSFSPGESFPTIGASGGVFGLLLAFGMAYPRRRVLLLIPPIPMPAWLFVTLYGLLELGLGVFRTQQGVAHFAHLGGMAAGFVLLQFWRIRLNAQRRNNA